MKQFIADFKGLWLYQALAKQINAGAFSHSHLFLCEDGFSAKVFARLIAQTIFCEQGNACGQCASCRKVLAETHPDFYVLPKEKSFLVANAEFIIENAYTKPINSDFKVFLIDDFDKAGVAAQNKILKILEEPTKNTFFLLNASGSQKILPTILSRTQKHLLPQFEKNELKNILRMHKYDFTESVFVASDGYLGKVLALLDNKDFAKSYNYVINTLKNLTSSKELIKYSAELADKASFVLKLEIFEKLLRNLLVLKSGAGHMLDETEKLIIMPFENDFSINALLNIFPRITNAKTMFEASVNLTTIADNLLLGILEDKFLWKQK